MIKLKDLIKEEKCDCGCGGCETKLNESVDLPQGAELGRVFTGEGFAFKKEFDEGTCGYGEDGKLGDKPAGPHLIDKDDFLIYLSGSGNSLNLVKCARKAKKRNIKQAALTGFNGGALNEIVDYPIHIKFEDMEICEDIQLSIFHYIKQRLINKYSESFENLELPKYQKRTLEDLIS